MNSLLISLIALAVVFAGGAIGLQLQRTLPEGAGVRDMIGAVVGLVTLLLALVLGLLVVTAYGIYSMQRASIQTVAISTLQLDVALREYGPDAAEGRTILRAGLTRMIAQVWGGGNDGDPVIKNYQFALSNLQEREAFLDSLQPSTDKQK